MSFIGFEKVSLNNRSVELNKGMYLDFNAIAKGYCVDLLSNALKKNNITNHLIEIGGEMYASGINNINNTRWKVGISDPLKPDDTKQKIFLKNVYPNIIIFIHLSIHFFADNVSYTGKSVHHIQ